MGDGPRGWRARATSRLRPEDPIELSLTERGDNAPRCSYYRSDDGAALRACPGCELTLHVTCWRELGACPTIGCAVTASEPFTGGPSLDALISQALEEAGCCAACQGAPRPGDPLWDCYACGLSRHVSCWRADKICQTQGCDVALRDMTHGRGRPDAVLSAGPRASARALPELSETPSPGPSAPWSWSGSTRSTP